MLFGNLGFRCPMRPGRPLARALLHPPVGLSGPPFFGETGRRAVAPGNRTPAGKECENLCVEIPLGDRVSPNAALYPRMPFKFP